MVVAMVSAVAGGAFWYRNSTATAATAEACEAVTELNELRDDAQPIGDGETAALILGDSYAQGQYLADPKAEAWSTLVAAPLGWTVTVDAVGGTGLVNDGPCDGQSIEQRAAEIGPAPADIVVIEAGLNDPPDERLGEALRTTIASLAAERVIVIGPVDAPDRDFERASAIDQILAEVSADLDALYVSALLWDTLTFLDDGVHLDPAGHADYASRVVGALATFS